MLKQFFFLLFLSFALSSAHRNPIVSVRSIEGEIIEFRKNQRFTMKITGRNYGYRHIYLTFVSNDNSNDTYIIDSYCGESKMDKYGFSYMECTADFLDFPRGNYILNKYGYTESGDEFDNITPFQMTILEDITLGIYLIDYQGDITATGENQPITLHFNNDITSFDLKLFKYLYLSAWRGMSSPKLDCREYLGKNALQCIGDFSGTYNYEHKIYSVAYNDTYFFARTEKKLTPKSEPTKNIGLEQITGDIKAFSANQELVLDFYDSKNNDKFDFNLNLNDIRYIRFFCFDDEHHKEYKVNLSCYSKVNRQNRNLVRCKGDFSNIEPKNKCHATDTRYKTFIIHTYAEFQILE